jgi:hypothetical protein
LPGPITPARAPEPPPTLGRPPRLTEGAFSGALFPGMIRPAKSGGAAQPRALATSSGDRDHDNDHHHHDHNNDNNSDSHGARRLVRENREQEKGGLMMTTTNNKQQQQQQQQEGGAGRRGGGAGAARQREPPPTAAAHPAADGPGGPPPLPPPPASADAAPSKVPCSALLPPPRPRAPVRARDSQTATAALVAGAAAAIADPAAPRSCPSPSPSSSSSSPAARPLRRAFSGIVSLFPSLLILVHACILAAGALAVWLRLGRRGARGGAEDAAAAAAGLDGVLLSPVRTLALSSPLGRAHTISPPARGIAIAWLLAVVVRWAAATPLALLLLQASRRRPALPATTRLLRLLPLQRLALVSSSILGVPRNTWLGWAVGSAAGSVPGAPKQQQQQEVAAGGHLSSVDGDDKAAAALPPSPSCPTTAAAVIAALSGAVAARTLAEAASGARDATEALFRDPAAAATAPGALLPLVAALLDRGTRAVQASAEVRRCLGEAPPLLQALLRRSSPRCRLYYARACGVGRSLTMLLLRLQRLGRGGGGSGRRSAGASAGLSSSSSSGWGEGDDAFGGSQLLFQASWVALQLAVASKPPRASVDDDVDEAEETEEEEEAAAAESATAAATTAMVRAAAALTALSAAGDNNNNHDDQDAPCLPAPLVQAALRNLCWALHAALQEPPDAAGAAAAASRALHAAGGVDVLAPLLATLQWGPAPGWLAAAVLAAAASGGAGDKNAQDAARRVLLSPEGARGLAVLLKYAPLPPLLASSSYFSSSSPSYASAVPRASAALAAQVPASAPRAVAAFVAAALAEDEDGVALATALAEARAVGSFVHSAPAWLSRPLVLRLLSSRGQRALEALARKRAYDAAVALAECACAPRAAHARVVGGGGGGEEGGAILLDDLDLESAASGEPTFTDVLACRLLLHSGGALDQLVAAYCERQAAAAAGATAAAAGAAASSLCVIADASAAFDALVVALAHLGHDGAGAQPEARPKHGASVAPSTSDGGGGGGSIVWGGERSGHQPCSSSLPPPPPPCRKIVVEKEVVKEDGDDDCDGSAAAAAAAFAPGPGPLGEPLWTGPPKAGADAAVVLLRWGCYSHGVDAAGVARLGAASKLVALFLPRASSSSSFSSSSTSPLASSSFPVPEIALSVPGFDDEASAWALRRIDAWCARMATAVTTTAAAGGVARRDNNADDSNDREAWARERAAGVAALCAVLRPQGRRRARPADLARLWAACEFLQVELLKCACEDLLVGVMDDDEEGVEGEEEGVDDPTTSALDVALDLCHWHPVSSGRVARLVARRVLAATTTMMMMAEQDEEEEGRSASGAAAVRRACTDSARRAALAAALKEEVTDWLVSACVM